MRLIVFFWLPIVAAAWTSWTCSQAFAQRELSSRTLQQTVHRTPKIATNASVWSVGIASSVRENMAHTTKNLTDAFSQNARSEREIFFQTVDRAAQVARKKLKSGSVKPAEIVALGREILAHSGKNLTDNFPQGSQGGRAREKIWSDWSAFVVASERFEQQARIFLDAATKWKNQSPGVGAPPSEVTRELEALFPTCGSCHRRFRSRR